MEQGCQALAACWRSCLFLGHSYREGVWVLWVLFRELLLLLSQGVACRGPEVAAPGTLRTCLSLGLRKDTSRCRNLGAQQTVTVFAFVFFLLLPKPAEEAGIGDTPSLEDQAAGHVTQGQWPKFPPKTWG